MLPLEGIRVLDFTHEVAGPNCTLLLADAGAEVIKIEIPGRGDRARHWPMMGESVFIACNRNKKSIALNLKTEEDRKKAYELVKISDVIVENFVPGTMERLGLGYETVRKLNPRIIYCSISGYGQEGPYMKKAAWDAIIQAETGLMDLTGQPDGPPCRIPSSIIDAITGAYAAYAILLALMYREKTGKGQRIDISLFDAAIHVQGYWIAWYTMTGNIPKRAGSASPVVGAPYEAFKTKDSYIFIAAFEDKAWQTLCKLLNIEHLLEDERFSSKEGRAKYRAELHDEIEKVTTQFTTNDLYQKLVEGGIVCAPVRTIPEVVNHPQVVYKGLLKEIEYKGKKVKVPGPFLRFSEIKLEVREKPAEIVGQHTEEILKKYGLI